MEVAAWVMAGALAGGLVSGLTGFGTGLSAMGIWLHVLSPSVAATLVIVCSVVSQLQTLPLIWGRITWGRVLPFVVPGLIGVPVGTFVLPFLDTGVFKVGVGAFLVAYPAYALLRRARPGTAVGGRWADATVGLGGGVLGGIAGLSGVLPVVWTDIRGWGRDERRMVLQSFNLSILLTSLIGHAATGLVTAELAKVAAMALPCTLASAWVGARIYRRLGDGRYQKVVLLLLLAAGLGLLWSGASVVSAAIFAS